MKCPFTWKKPPGKIKLRVISPVGSLRTGGFPPQRGLCADSTLCSELLQLRLSFPRTASTPCDAFPGAQQKPARRLQRTAPTWSVRTRPILAVWSRRVLPRQPLPCHSLRLARSFLRSGGNPFQSLRRSAWLDSPSPWQALVSSLGAVPTASSTSHGLHARWRSREPAVGHEDALSLPVGLNSCGRSSFLCIVISNTVSIGRSSSSHNRCKSHVVNMVAPVAHQRPPPLSLSPKADAPLVHVCRSCKLSICSSRYGPYWRVLVAAPFYSSAWISV